MENIICTKKTNFSSHTISTKDVDWPFSDTYFKSVGLSVRGFQFLLPKLSYSLKSIFQPSANLVNPVTGTDEIKTLPTQYSFYSKQEAIEENINVPISYKKYKNVPINYFINESYFLFDKSDLIKETYITALNKKYLHLVP